MAELHVLRQPDRRDMDRLAVTPPITGMESCFNDDVCEGEVLYRPLIPGKDADSAIGIVNGEVAERVVPHRVLIEPTDPYGRRAGDHRAIGDIDVHGGVPEPPVSGEIKVVAVTGENQAVIPRADVAVGDQDIAARRKISSVVVGHQQIAPDPYARHEDAIAVGTMHCPEGGVCNQQVAEHDVAAPGENDHLKGTVKRNCRAIADAGGHLPEVSLLTRPLCARILDLLRTREIHECVAVPVDGPRPRDRDIFRILRKEKPDELPIQIVVPKPIASFQDGAALKGELDIAAEAERTGEEDA